MGAKCTSDGNKAAVAALKTTQEEKPGHNAVIDEKAETKCLEALQILLSKGVLLRSFVHVGRALVTLSNTDVARIQRPMGVALKFLDVLLHPDAVYMDVELQMQIAKCACRYMRAAYLTRQQEVKLFSSVKTTISEKLDDRLLLVNEVKQPGSALRYYLTELKTAIDVIDAAYHTEDVVVGVLESLAALVTRRDVGGLIGLVRNGVLYAAAKFQEKWYCTALHGRALMQASVSLKEEDERRRACTALLALVAKSKESYVAKVEISSLYSLVVVCGEAILEHVRAGFIDTAEVLLIQNCDKETDDDSTKKENNKVCGLLSYYLHKDWRIRDAVLDACLHLLAFGVPDALRTAIESSIKERLTLEHSVSAYQFLQRRDIVVEIRVALGKKEWPEAQSFEEKMLAMMSKTVPLTLYERVLQMRANVLAGQTDAELAMQIPMHGQVSEEAFARSFPLEEYIWRFLSKSKHDALLLLGASGQGKSTFLQRIATLCFQQYNRNGYIPLFVSLPLQQKPYLSCIPLLLTNAYGFHADQIATLQREYKFLFLFDAYDEVPSGLNNVYTTFGLQRFTHCKIITTCRTRFVTAFKNYERRFCTETNQGRTNIGAFDKVFFSKVTEANVMDYIDRHVAMLQQQQEDKQRREETHTMDGKEDQHFPRGFQKHSSTLFGDFGEDAADPASGGVDVMFGIDEGDEEEDMIAGTTVGIDTFGHVDLSVWTAVKFKQVLKSMPDLQIDTPYMLSIALNTIPVLRQRFAELAADNEASIAASGADNHAVLDKGSRRRLGSFQGGVPQMRPSKYTLFSVFTELFFARQRRKLEVRSAAMADRVYEPFLDESSDDYDLIADLRRFSLRLASAMQKHGVTNAFYVRGATPREKHWSEFFRNSKKDAASMYVNVLREGSPIQKVGQHSWGFLHKSLQDFFLATGMMYEIFAIDVSGGNQQIVCQREQVSGLILNRRALLFEELQFAAEFVQTQTARKQKVIVDRLLFCIELSKDTNNTHISEKKKKQQGQENLDDDDEGEGREEAEEVRQSRERLEFLASNSLSILNYCRLFSFSGKDFSHVRAPFADLSGAVCHETKFVGANLRQIQIQRALLHMTDFTDADLTQVQLHSAGRFRGHTHDVNGIATVMDGTRVMSGSADKTVILWDTNIEHADGDPLQHIMKEHTAVITSVSVSPVDSYLVVTGSWDKSIRVWDLRTLSCVACLTGHSSSVHAVKFDHTGSKLVSGSEDKTVGFWNIAKLVNALPQLRGGEEEQAATLAKHKCQGCRVPTEEESFTHTMYDETKDLWEMTDAGRDAHTKQVACVDFSLDGKLACSGSADGSVAVWSVTPAGTCALVWLKKSAHSMFVSCIAWDPNHPNQFATGSYDAYLRVWAASEGKMLGEWKHAVALLRCMTWRKDGYILSGAKDNVIRLHDMTAVLQHKDDEPVEFQGHVGSVYSISEYSKSSFVSGGNDFAVMQWSHAMGTKSNSRAVVSDWQSHSADGKWLAMAGLREAVCRILDSRTGVVVAELFHCAAQRESKASNEDVAQCVLGISDVAFHPVVPSHILVVYDSDACVRMWDVNTTQVLFELDISYGHASKCMMKGQKRIKDNLSRVAYAENQDGCEVKHVFALNHVAILSVFALHGGPVESNGYSPVLLRRVVMGWWLGLHLSPAHALELSPCGQLLLVSGLGGRHLEVLSVDTLLDVENGKTGDAAELTPLPSESSCESSAVGGRFARVSNFNASKKKLKNAHHLHFVPVDNSNGVVGMIGMVNDKKMTEDRDRVHCVVITYYEFKLGTTENKAQWLLTDERTINVCNGLRESFKPSQSCVLPGGFLLSSSYSRDMVVLDVRRAHEGFVYCLTPWDSAPRTARTNPWCHARKGQEHFRSAMRAPTHLGTLVFGFRYSALALKCDLGTVPAQWPEDEKALADAIEKWQTDGQLGQVQWLLGMTSDDIHNIKVTRANISADLHRFLDTPAIGRQTYETPVLAFQGRQNMTRGEKKNGN